MAYIKGIAPGLTPNALPPKLAKEIPPSSPRRPPPARRAGAC